MAGSAADRPTFFLLGGVVGDGPRDLARTPPPTPLHARRAGRGNYRFFKKKKRTSNQEGGPRVLGSRLLIIHPLPHMAGSAADRSTFFLLNGVVGDGPRAHSTLPLHAEPGRMAAVFFLFFVDNKLGLLTK